MFPVEVIIRKLGNHPIIIYQYRQVQNRVNSLRKCYKIFPPLKDFELWITDIDKQTKLLSKLYNLLSSLQMVKNPARPQWELDLNTEKYLGQYGENYVSSAMNFS